MMRRQVFVAIVVSAGVAAAAATPATQPAELWRQVEIIRTAHGVPHIRAENLRAGGYGLAWVMSEDYGPRTGMRLIGARGELSRFEGRGRLDADFTNRRARARAIATYHLLDPETRDLYDGFAAGINRYVQLNPEEFPDGMPADFSGYDVATSDIGDPPPAAKVRRFLAALGAGASPDAALAAANRDEDGTNAGAPSGSPRANGAGIGGFPASYREWFSSLADPPIS